MARAAGGVHLGASLYELPPGAAAWPLHYHLANEEALWIIKGQATLELGDERHDVRAGHDIALPPDRGLITRIA